MKLEIDLIPETSFYKNVRQILTPVQWKAICKQVYDKYNYRCSICGGIGNKHPVEAHELWKYDEKKLIQKLSDIIALCPTCHMTVHFGFAQIRGKGDEALKHFMKINQLSKFAAKKSIAEAFLIWRKRSEKKWSLDISLIEDYGIDLSKIKMR